MNRFLLAVVGLILACPVSAHDHWINRGGYMVPVAAPAYTGPEKCCGEGDCTVVNPDDLEVRGTSFYIRFLNETIPMSEVLWESPDGQYYRCATSEGKRKCFFAPPTPS